MKKVLPITNLIQQLKEKYATNTTIIGITDWINQLETHNIHFLDLVKKRYNTLNLNNISTMIQIRKEIDGKYAIIVNLINAVILVEGGSHYQPFVDALNLRIIHYRNVLLQRKGILHKKVQKEDEGKE